MVQLHQDTLTILLGVPRSIRIIRSIRSPITTRLPKAPPEEQPHPPTSERAQVEPISAALPARQAYYRPPPFVY